MNSPRLSIVIALLLLGMNIGFWVSSFTPQAIKPLAALVGGALSVCILTYPVCRWRGLLPDQPDVSQEDEGDSAG